jgi:predicted alpha/beta-fold hydrolase
MNESARVFAFHDQYMDLTSNYIALHGMEGKNASRFIHIMIDPIACQFYNMSILMNSRN